MQLALDEGWIQKKGSKWRTMPEVMLRYRAASLFGKLYAPELLMGLQSKDEIEDIAGEVVEAETPVYRTQPAIKSISESSWEIDDLEAFDALMDSIYAAFKDAGYGQEYEAFAIVWRAKRGKGDPKGIIRDLSAERERFTTPAVVESES